MMSTTTTRKKTEPAIWPENLEVVYDFKEEVVEWSPRLGRVLPRLMQQTKNLPGNSMPYLLGIAHSRGHATSCMWGIRSGQYGPDLYAWIVKYPNAGYEDSWKLIGVRKAK
jgi:hypothetical protein